MRSVLAATWHQAVRHAVDWFAALGLPMTELPMRNRTQARSEATVEAARSAGATYLCGGDPGIVVSTLRDTPGWEALRAAWHAGAALAGSSAGAMALGEWTLLKGRMPGDHERRYADALGLVPGVAVIPHWDEFGATWLPSAIFRPVPAPLTSATSNLWPRVHCPFGGTTTIFLVSAS